MPECSFVFILLPVEEHQNLAKKYLFLLAERGREWEIEKQAKNAVF